MQRYILLVDNDEEEHLIFTSVIESMKTAYRVENAYNAKEAIAKIKEALPSFIFLDIHMPVDGFACLEKIKALPECSNIPVYFYSSRADEKNAARAKQAGAAGIIEKKADVSELRNALQLIFDRRREDVFIKL